MWIRLFHSFICALTFRIRGGLRIWKDKKFPLNKWWFAIWFPAMHCIVRGWSSAFFITGVIASKMCTEISGWGSYIGVLFSGIINKLDKDDLNITEFVQTKLFKILFTIVNWCRYHKLFTWVYKLIKLDSDDYQKYPRLYGWLCLSLRGGLTTFILGLWLNNYLYMPVGLLQGTVYWLGHLTCKYIYDDGKLGWKISEWYWGFVLGFFSLL